MMTKTLQIVKEARRFLGLRLPLRVWIYQADETPEGWDGAHILKRRKRHLIEVARNPSRGRYSVLAHELVHAYVQELDPEAEAHGLLFQYYAQQFENHLQSLGFDVENIFEAAIDK